MQVEAAAAASAVSGPRDAARPGALLQLRRVGRLVLRDACRDGPHRRRLDQQLGGPTGKAARAGLTRTMFYFMYNVDGDHGEIRVGCEADSVE